MDSGAILTLSPAASLVSLALARENLYLFSRLMFLQRHGYRWQQAEHHRTICDALMRVYKGKTRRLIINVPPRYSKTELAVINFIAWSLGRDPDAEFIHTSYGARLAANNSMSIRDLVQTEIYQKIFPKLALRKDSKARDEWKTTKGGCVYATGSGGAITGYGAGKHRNGFGGAIIIDDPHKADEARSETMRNNVIDWFRNTLESRKNTPKTPIVLIMQRLHENDLSGWLLNGGNGEQWEHICLPALRDDGTALWPEKHNVEMLREMELASPYVFAGQYQQRPSPLQGGVIKPDALQIVDAIPAGHIDWMRGWDLAATTDGDHTAGVRLGKMSDGRYIIADVVRLRGGPDERDAALINTATRDGRHVKISLPQDPGQAGKTQALYLTRALSGFSVNTSPESGDKITRAEPLAAQINVGNVMLLRAEWNDKFIDEMRMFPNGAHDDQVDAASRAFEALMGGSTGMLDWMRQQFEAKKMTATYENIN